MAEAQGSRWYFPVYEGLFDAKHQEQMGPALWLYGWMLARAWVAQHDGVLSYSHIEAANELGVDVRTIKRWFSLLQESVYITTRARHAYHLEVAVTNWRTTEEWLDARGREGRSAISVTPEARSDRIAERSDKRSDTRSDRTVTSLPITIRLSGYQYPPDGVPSGGADAPTAPNLADAFAGLMEQLRAEKNKPALLQEIYGLCFGASELPEYGYLGKVARAVGGAGRLAQILWQLSADRPQGDVLAYVLAMHKGKGSNGHRSAQDNTNNVAPHSAFQEMYEQQQRDGHL